MIVILLLIPLSILIACCFLVAFIWAVRSGQYEDMGTPSLRVLFEERRPDIHKPNVDKAEAKKFRANND